MNQMAMFRLAALAVLLTAPLLAQSSEYTLVELPPPFDPTFPPITSGAWGINDAGQIVGGVFLMRSSAHVPVLWEDGTAPAVQLGGALATGSSRISRAFAINERGQIVGRGIPVFPGLTPHAFLWENGTATDLGTPFLPLGADPRFSSSSAVAINDAGQIVGQSNGTAVLWDHGAAINLGTLPGTVLSVAAGINNRGQIVGTSDGRAWVWQDGVMTELPGLSGPVDINDAGQIVGVAGGHAVVWDHGAMIVLNLPPGPVSTVAINDLGHVAATIDGVGVVWRNGEVLTLPTLDGQAVEGHDINNRSDVVGRINRASNMAVLWVAPATAEDQLAEALALLQSYNLQRLGNSLPHKLEDARAFLAAGATSDACETLTGFLNQVRAQSGKALTVEQATELRLRATRIRNVIGC